MKQAIDKILNEYVSAKRETYTGHPLASFIRHNFPDVLSDTGVIDQKKYILKGSVGQSKWNAVPWVGIFDSRITTSAQRGVYVVYLFAEDGETLYLTLNQGCEEIRKRFHSKSKTVEILRKNAAKITSSINGRGFKSDNNINLGDIKNTSAEYYQPGTIFYTEYKKGAVPPEETLREDLSNMMEIYREYASSFLKEEKHVEQPETMPHSASDGGKQDVTIKRTVEAINRYIAAVGFTYPAGLIENFWISLKSKPFVILAGTSGTGKTRLVRLFANAISAEYKLVAVRPDWSDSSDLFGHVDLNGAFIPGDVLEFMNRAKEDPQKPYILCLDEMNLARVEYYLSDVLSIMETRELNNGVIESDPILVDSYYGKDAAARERYGTQCIPENFYIVGTVNMDETTFPFSRKVLDRANTIEFSYADLLVDFDAIPAESEKQELSNDFLKTEYLFFSQCVQDKEFIRQVCVKLQRINEILQKANAQVGYRVRDEIVFYMLNNKKAGLINDKVALDNEIMQKILPRIQGSSASIKKLLCELFVELEGSYSDVNGSESENMLNFINEKADTLRYPQSASKLYFMTRRFEEDGFTSYWL